MTVPSERNIALKEMEKKSKYKDLKLEMQRMQHMKTIVIPVVLVYLLKKKTKQEQLCNWCFSSSPNQSPSIAQP